MPPQLHLIAALPPALYMLFYSGLLDHTQLIEMTNSQIASSAPHYDFQDQRSGWKNFLAFVGPGFLVSLAYLDPGNLETDLQAGADHKYELLWVILVGLVFALVIQSLAANLGVCTEPNAGRQL